MPFLFHFPAANSDGQWPIGIDTCIMARGPSLPHPKELGMPSGLQGSRIWGAYAEGEAYVVYSEIADHDSQWDTMPVVGTIKSIGKIIGGKQTLGFQSTRLCQEQLP
jgi:hypothetical protein